MMAGRFVSMVWLSAKSATRSVPREPRRSLARATFCPSAASSYSLVWLSQHGMFPPRSSCHLLTSSTDGALGSWGSAMLEPYSDAPSTTGSLLVDAETLTNLTSLWSAASWQVNIHAIGDLANRLAVDAFTTALHALCSPSEPLSVCQALHRFRIEHAQIIHPDDQRRIHQLGIIPSIQPTHATSDMKYALSRLGASRLSSSAYRMKSLLDVRPVLGSDFPVEPPNPFHGMYAAVARRDPATGLGSPDATDHGWHMEEALSMEEALKGFTKGPAYGAFMEGKAGSITEGGFADWIVLDEQLPSDLAHVEDLRKLKVRQTWVGGKRVYSRV